MDNIKRDMLNKINMTIAKGAFSTAGEGETDSLRARVKAHHVSFTPSSF